MHKISNLSEAKANKSLKNRNQNQERGAFITEKRKNRLTLKCLID